MSAIFSPIARRCLWGLLLAGSASVASAQPQPPAKFVFWSGISQGQWFRFALTAGRIRPTWLQTHPINHNGLNQNGIQERISIQANPREAQYTYTSPQLNLTLNFTESKLTIQVVPQGNAIDEPLEFVQPMGEPLVLKLGPPERTRVIEAKSLWHLLLLEPEAAKPLVTWLQLLRLPSGSANLSKTLEEAQAILVRNAQGPQTFDQGRLRALVAQLGENQFARREAADREIRALGVKSLPYLEQINTAELDLEQQYRVRRILVSLTRSQSGDTAEWIASWLQEDAQVWLALLSRPDPVVRRLAVARLQAILNRPIAVDPAGDDAVRKQQIESLRAELRRPADKAR